MDFEWDEEKRLKNIEKHGIDFIDADILFGNPHLVAPGKTVDGEQRWLATGMIDEDYVTAVFTRRGPVIRMISSKMPGISYRSGGYGKAYECLRTFVGN